ncbi:putative Cys-rich domain protein [Opisthorchis viverrini]|uniref:Putative Cys-rich domain protein n=1 Tax=Opisthorchis viverrini TaxID=6198 RepID=A0A1S8WMI4_OPIVI|nr:putative Cys-rich domain protein [Opisthorchis viverrini]
MHRITGIGKTDCSIVKMTINLVSLLIAFCYPCYMCYMYSRYEECCATPIAILAPGLVLRAYHRGKHRIGGTLFRDWVADCCCPLCAACQLDRDMRYIEKTTGELNI